MTKQMKLAIIIAPFLLLGGYLLADYSEQQKQQEVIYPLSIDGSCDIIHKRCLLNSGKLQINLYQNAALTTVNATFPIKTAVFFTVDNHDQATVYPLVMQQSPYYFASATKLPELLANKGDKIKYRLIITADSGKYIGEFYSQTLQ